MEETPSTSQPKSIRLTPEEIRFLEEHEIKLSSLAHNSIELEMSKKEKEKNSLTRKQKVNKAITNGIFLIIGIMFLWTLNFTATLISIVIIVGIGFGFTIIGGWGLYSGMKAEGIKIGFTRAK